MQRQPSNGVRSRWPLVAVLVIYALHGFSYGTAFLTNPAEMAQEFGANDPPSEAAARLTGLVGAWMVLAALAAVLAAYWTGRYACREGAWVAGALGIVSLVTALYWGIQGSAWDLGIQGAFGVLLLGLSLRLLRGIQAEEIG